MLSGRSNDLVISFSMLVILDSYVNSSRLRIIVSRLGLQESLSLQKRTISFFQDWRVALVQNIVVKCKWFPFFGPVLVWVQLLRFWRRWSQVLMGRLPIAIVVRTWLISDLVLLLVWGKPLLWLSLPGRLFSHFSHVFPHRFYGVFQLLLLVAVAFFATAALHQVSCASPGEAVLSLVGTIPSALVRSSFFPIRRGWSPASLTFSSFTHFVVRTNVGCCIQHFSVVLV